jgi:hypothetical protein
MILLLLLALPVQPRPEAYLLQPLPRDKMSSLAVVAPCGGVMKGKSHFLAQPGSFNPISWHVVVPSAGTCTLRVMFGTEFSEQHVLVPTDNSTDSFGFFPCGESEGSFSKVFKFPDEVSCDSCTLQWVWKSSLETYYLCSDIEILEDKDAACYGKCKNGGFCNEGLCVCPDGFIGTFCETDDRFDPVNILYLFLALMFLMIVASILLSLLFWRFRKSRPSYIERLCFEKCCFWLPYKWNQWNREDLK